MKLPIYQIDAFAKHNFEGNPAAVVPLEEWISDEIMQSIAAENNLAETAFYVPDETGYHIRWFTPEKEVKLCGHATLASAYVLFNIAGIYTETIVFNSLSGPLSVSQKDDLLILDFPSQPPASCEVPHDLVKGLGKNPERCLRSEDYVVVFENEEDIYKINPDHNYLKKLDLRAVIVTAPAQDYDFIARVFAPKYGIPEDPVTGSAYTQLMPFWYSVYGKRRLKARQVSNRGGDVFCELKNDRVLISGYAVKYLEGIIEVEQDR